jgi:hypothetical protein
VRGDRVLVELGVVDTSRNKARQRLACLLALLQYRPTLLQEFSDMTRRMSLAAGRRPVPARAAWEQLRVRVLSESGGVGIENDLASLMGRLAVAAEPSLRRCLKLRPIAGLTESEICDAARRRGILPAA